MAQLIADTNAFIWHLTSPDKLGRSARRALDQADGGRISCHVPAISLVEAWLLYERARIRVSPARLVEAMARHPGYAILPFDILQAMEFGSLTTIRDPMDRMIVAAARATGSRLITADTALDAYGVDIIWD